MYIENGVINGLEIIKVIKLVDGDDNTMANLLSTLSMIIVILTPIISKLADKIWQRRKEQKEENKIESESTKLNSEARKADAETITERASADKIYVETARSLMDEQKELFEGRVALIQQRQQDEILQIKNKQIEQEGQLAEIRAENLRIKQENERIKRESLELHQENVQLHTVINKLQTAIKGLKKLIEKLMFGINKLIVTYEEDHKGVIPPWKPILTDEEQLLFQSDFSELNPYK